MLKIIVCGLLFFSNLVFCEPVLVMATPKCGTHMLRKLLTMIYEQHVGFYVPIVEQPYKILDIENDFIVLNHPYPGFDAYIDSKFKKIVLVRDPKDALISFINWVDKDKRWGNWTPKQFISFFNSLDEEKKVNLAILFPDSYMGLKFFYNQSIKWIDAGAYVVYFEDIVGPQGLGDKDIQRDTIVKLAHYLDQEMYEEKLDYICDNLFGNDELPDDLKSHTTFNQGQIGSWKYYFTQENKLLFDEVFGDISERLGYSNDDEANSLKFYYDHPWTIKNIYN